MHVLLGCVRLFPAMSTSTSWIAIEKPLVPKLWPRIVNPSDYLQILKLHGPHIMLPSCQDEYQQLLMKR